MELRFKKFQTIIATITTTTTTTTIDAITATTFCRCVGHHFEYAHRTSDDESFSEIGRNWHGSPTGTSHIIRIGCTFVKDIIGQWIGLRSNLPRLENAKG
jgi:hypothetical protein